MYCKHKYTTLVIEVNEHIMSDSVLIMEMDVYENNGIWYYVHEYSMYASYASEIKLRRTDWFA